MEENPMEWQGHNSVAGMVEKRLVEAAIMNPGPMRSISFRIPVSAEARLMVLSDLLKQPKTTLLRELVMAALLEAEEEVLEKALGDEGRKAYFSELERYREMLSDGVVTEPGLSIGPAKIVSVEKVEEGEAS